MHKKYLLRHLIILLLLATNVRSVQLDGSVSLAHGEKFFAQGDYDAAAAEFWKAILLHAQSNNAYNVQEVFSRFMKCYILQDRTVDGLVFVSQESFMRGQPEMGQNYLNQALQMDPNHAGALRVQAQYVGGEGGDDRTASDQDHDDPLSGKTPEELYAIASNHFAAKEYEECADIFELSCQLSHESLGPSCGNAVYCRTLLADWGFNGSQFDADMNRITALTKKEAQMNRYASSNSTFVWQRATSVHPHMMLGFPVDPTLKRYVAEAVAFVDEKMARVSLRDKQDVTLPDLPDGMPFEYDPEVVRAEFEDSKSRLRVGFVGSGFNSKAVLFLSMDMFRFFDESFEIHVFSFGPPDNEGFLTIGMRGVDWRKQVQTNVDYFHDLQRFSKNHIDAARFIHDHNIHVLIEWDGYARQGERAQGLFALRPAPIQMLHQEYLGSSGALYVDYIFSDVVASPPELSGLYVEKIIYLPNHFFSKGHAFQAEVSPPAYDYQPVSMPYRLGTGSPAENRCLAPRGVGPDEPFVFCNFNKFLKNNPETMRSWIRILREVPNAMLCLVENPTEGVVYLRRFVHEAAATSADQSVATMVPGDGDELNKRIHVLGWQRNPFDHQRRSFDFCNVMLDSFPYNGHTVANDALYAGVPIVTRSDGKDMASRVTTSANIVLGLDDWLNGKNSTHYEDIAIQLARDRSLYRRIRAQLIDSCLQKNPIHRYWDVGRYVKNFQEGVKAAWQRFLDGSPPEHIFVEETEAAAKGTYEGDIEAHPVEGRKLRMQQILRTDA